MSFIWPPMLILLALVPAGLLAYRAIDRRRRAAAARSGFGAISGAGSAGPSTARRAGVRSRIPTAFFLVGLTLMVLALARPQGAVGLPRAEGTVILAYDVSGSMAADDLKPTRMDAAKAATEAFVAEQPSGVVIGVVAFSDSGVSVQTPTRDDGTVTAAINRLTPQRGTSLAQGIQASLQAITVAENGGDTNYYSNREPRPTPTPAPVAPGSHSSAVIVLLTDGENNEQPDPLDAAAAAADQGIRIYTVGLGSAAGTTLNLNGFQVHTQLNEPLLQQIASVTGGEYFQAPDAQTLKSIYNNLGSRLTLKNETIEVTALFAGVSVILLVAGGLLSLLWLGRLP